MTSLNNTEQSIKETINIILEEVEKNRSQRYIEYEIRIGHIFPNYFSTELNKKHYDLIKKSLDTMPSDIHTKNSKKYTVEYDSDSRRKTTAIDMEDDEGKNTIIKKTMIQNLDFSIENSPFDVRFSVSKEQPVKLFNEKEITKKFVKERTSYIYKSWIYDLTITDDNKFSIEIEIDPKVLKGSDAKKILYSTLMKINSLSKLVENSEPGQYILNKKAVQ